MEKGGGLESGQQARNKRIGKYDLLYIEILSVNTTYYI